MPLDSAHDALLIPERQLPDGSVQWTEHAGTAAALNDALKAYDERLSLVLNFARGRWEVWRLGEDAKPRRVMSCPDGGRVPNVDHLLSQMRQFDTHHGYDPVDAAIAADAAAQRARDAAWADRMDDAGDRLHHALAKDLAPHAPAARPIPLGGP